MARILVVEDEPGFQELVLDLLKREGHAVELAPDGAAGLELLKKSSYDLLIVDWQMPRLSGMDVMESLRMNPTWRPRKVLMFTSLNAVKEVDQAFAAGIEDFLVKPFLMDQFLARVRKLLQA